MKEGKQKPQLEDITVFLHKDGGTREMCLREAVKIDNPEGYAGKIHITATLLWKLISPRCIKKQV